jgi:hypothetical protein
MEKAEADALIARIADLEARIVRLEELVSNLQDRPVAYPSNLG